MKRLGVLLVLALLASGCNGFKAYLPIINASLIGGKGVVKATYDNRVEAKDAVGCYVTSSLVTSLDTTQQTVASWSTASLGDKVIPAVDVDVAACHALLKEMPEPLIGEKAEAKVQSILKNIMPSVLGVLKAILESNDVSCRDLAIVEAVLKYLEGAAPAVVAELAKPDGKIKLPAVKLALDGCNTDSQEAVPPAARKCPPCKCEAKLLRLRARVAALSL